MDKNKIKILFLGLILIVGLFLRLYKLPDRMVFDWDQERDTNAVKTILVEHKPLLIGPRIMALSFLLSKITKKTGIFFIIFIFMTVYSTKSKWYRFWRNRSSFTRDFFTLDILCIIEL